MAAFGVRKLFTLFCATPRHPFAYPSSGGVKTITTTIIEKNITTTTTSIGTHWQHSNFVPPNFVVVARFTANNNNLRHEFKTDNRLREENQKLVNKAITTINSCVAPLSHHLIKIKVRRLQALIHGLSLAGTRVYSCMHVCVCSNSLAALLT